jgi:type II secretory pathway component GspD/PulD (secretin)
MLRNLFNAFFIVLTVLSSTTIGHAADITIDSSSSFLYPGYSQKISMDFQNASLVDVLKIFSQQTKINLVSSEELAAKRITVFLDNVPVEQALEQVLRANNLTYELQPDSNIYVVKPITKTDSELLTRVYLLKYANVSTARISKTLKIIYNIGDSTNEVTESSSGGSGGGGSSGGGGGESSTGIMIAIKGILTAKGKIMEDPRTNSLTVTDIASNFRNIETAISKLDIAVPQVLIEVEMLEISKENADKIGIKYGETPLTFTGAERSHIYPWDQNALLAKGYAFAEAEYRAGTISAAGMTAILQFLQTQTDTKNLARPRILTLSNQPAQIKISTNESVGVKQQTSSAQNIATSSSEAERVETGVFLTVTPQVNSVNNEITMAVVPKVITTRLSTVFNNNVFFKDPEERGSLSILRVTSGDTVVLGGLLREDRATITTKLPILGDIPFIGAAFRHKSDAIANRELIIFLTPHILAEGLEQNIALPKQPVLREQREQAPNKQQAIDRALTKRKEL